MRLEEPVALPALVDHDVPARPAGAGRAAPEVQAGIATAALDLADQLGKRGRADAAHQPQSQQSAGDGFDQRHDRRAREQVAQHRIHRQHAAVRRQPETVPVAGVQKVADLAGRQRAPKASSSNR